MTLALVLAAVAAATWYYQRQQGRPGAGASSAARARRLRTPLVRLATLAGISTARGRMADQCDAGAVGEKRTAARLDLLARQGWMVVHDRAIPGSAANIDHLLVSPARQRRAGVVFLVDSKLWGSRYTLRADGDRLLLDAPNGHTKDVTGRLRGLHHGTRIVARELGCPVIPLVSMEGPRIQGGQLLVDGVRIVPADQVVIELRKLARRYAAPGPHPGARAGALFKPYRRK